MNDVPHVPYHEFGGTGDGEPGRIPLPSPSFVGDQLLVAAGITEDDPTRPVLMFAFGQGRQLVAPVGYTPETGADPIAALDTVARLVHDAVDGAKRAYVRATRPTRNATCAVCGVRIYGDVAARGACTACAPPAPIDGAADLEGGS